MKKYILSAAAFLMIAGIAGAQTTKTSTDKSGVKSHKTTSAKKPSVSSSVSSTTPTTDKSINSTATIKRKHHKKSKSVPASK
jgi:hypothetical protein